MRYLWKRFTILAILLPATVAGGEEPAYRTSIALSDSRPGEVTSVTFRFEARGDDYQKLDVVEVDLAPGTGVVARAFATKCVLEEIDSDGGEICPEKFPAAKIGSGKITSSMWGHHTVRGEAYLVDEKNTPRGANLLFFFPSGQAIGVGAQSIFASMSLGATSERKMRMEGIQDQLSLPFGMSSRLVEGEFAFTGQGGQPPYTNPTEGSLEQWVFATRLGWSGGAQTQRIHARLAD